MTKKEEDFPQPSTKKLRFRGDLNLYHFDNHVEDIFDDVDRRKFKSSESNTDDPHKKGTFLTRLTVDSASVVRWLGKVIGYRSIAIISDHEFCNGGIRHKFSFRKAIKH